MIPPFEYYSPALCSMPSVSVLLGTATLALAAPGKTAVVSNSLQLPNYHHTDESLFYQPVAGASPEEVLRAFANRLLRDSVDLPPAVVEMIDEHFWELLL